MGNTPPSPEDQSNWGPIVCPACGNRFCGVQSVGVWQRGLEVAVACRHLLSRDKTSSYDGYLIELRFFCAAGHRFALDFRSMELGVELTERRLATVPLPLLELER